MDRSRPVADLERHRFERTLRPHMDALRRLALRLTGTRDDADDLVQEFLAHLYPRADTVTALDQPRPWLTRVLYRLFVDRWRRRRADPVVDGGPDPDAGAGAADDLPEAVFERRLTAERLQRALDRLGADHRELLILHDVEGYTLPEVAATTDVALGTLKSRLHRARERLRAELAAGADGTFAPRDS